MGKRSNPVKEQEDFAKKAKIVKTMVARRDFADSEFNEHKAGEPCDVTQDELERALIPHGLVTTPEAWKAHKAAELAQKKADAALAAMSGAVATAADGDADDENEDGDAGTVASGKDTQTSKTKA